MELRVVTHSGEDLIVEEEHYNAKELNEILNNPDIYTVTIGDVIFSRIDIKLVLPVEGE